MIATFMLAAIIARGPVVLVKPAPVTDSWLCSHASVFFCPIFPKLGEPAPKSQKHIVKPRKP